MINEENREVALFTNPKIVRKKPITAVLIAQLFTAVLIVAAFFAVKLLFPDLFAALKAYIVSYIG